MRSQFCEKAAELVIDIAHFTIVPAADTVDGPVVAHVMELALGEVAIESRLRAILGGEGSRRMIGLVRIEIVDPQKKALVFAGLEPLEDGRIRRFGAPLRAFGLVEDVEPADRPEYFFSGVALTKAAVR